MYQWMICIVIALIFILPYGHGRDLPEHQIKAAFLFNFSAFVSWPESMFETPGEPLRYCVLGEEEVGQSLAQLISGESLDGRPLEMMYPDEESDLTSCHILYLGSDTSTESVLQSVKGRDILTVGDSENFTDLGGMISLLRKRKRIQPVVNMDALEQSNFRLSSKLLRLATRVRPGNEE